MDKKKISIGIPIGCYVDPDFALSLAALCYHRSELYNIMGVCHARGCYVTMNRNRLVDTFIEKDDADWLVMFDTDLSFDQGILERLCILADETSSKVVAGWYLSRNKTEILPLVYKTDSNGFINIEPNEDNSPTKVSGIATGCLMVHKEVYRSIKKDPTNRIFYFGDTFEEFEDESKHKALGEDLMFSLNCAKSGYDIYTRKDLRAMHHKIGMI